MAGKMRNISQFQAELGLPRTDVVKTRQNVRLLFTVYRQYKANLTSGRPLDLQPIPELERYPDCVDPDTIRAVNKPSSGNRPPDEREMMMRDFMKAVDQKVSRLKELQREILQAKFMGDEELCDVDAMNRLEQLGFYMGEATYGRTKQAAMLKLASVMGLTSFRD